MAKNEIIHRIINSKSIILYSKSISPGKSLEMESYPLYGDNLYLRRYILNGKLNYKISYLEPEKRIIFNTDGIKYADKVNVYITKSSFGQISVCVNINKFGYILFNFKKGLLTSIYHNTNKIYEIISDGNGNVITIRNAYYNGAISLYVYKYTTKGNLLIENCKKISGLTTSDLLSIDDNQLLTDQVNIYKGSELIHQSINNGSIIRTIQTTPDNNKLETVVNASNNLVKKILYYYDENHILRSDSLGKKYDIEVNDHYINSHNVPDIMVQSV